MELKEKLVVINNYWKLFYCHNINNNLMDIDILVCYVTCSDINYF